MTHLRAALGGWVSWSRASGASPETIRLRIYHLGRLIEATQPTPLDEMTTDHLLAYLSRAGWSPETRKSVRGAIRSYFTYAVDAGLVDKDPSRSLPKVRVPAGKPRPAPSPVLADALTNARARERLMLMFAAYAGLRRAEIARVHSDDIRDGQLRVKGKGGRIRVVPLHPLLVAEMGGWTSGWLFPGQDDGHLSPGHVGVLVRRALGNGWSAHTLRHRFATRAYAVERDLLAVQALLGHSKPETTKRYTAIPDGALNAAVLGV